MSYAAVDLSSARVDQPGVWRVGNCSRRGKVRAGFSQGTLEVHEKRSATMHAAAGVLNTDAQPISAPA